MLPSKLRERSQKGPITPLSTRPALVKNSRLAFNMRGFPPFEPRMAGFEDRDVTCENSECHGALVELSRDDYERVWLSEGGGSEKPGYEEVAVDAIPYDNLSTGSDSVKAVAYRVRQQVKDGPPSKRYMNILINGAREIKLTDSYVKSLEAVKTESPPRILKFVGYYNFFITGLLWRLNLRAVSSVNSNVAEALFFGGSNRMLKSVSNVLLLLWMLPGAFVGALIRLVMLCKGKEVSPMIKAVFADEE